MDFILTDVSGRVIAWTFDSRFSKGFVEVGNLPSNFHECPLGDWTYIDGEFTNDGSETDARKDAEEKEAKERAEREEIESASRDFFKGGCEQLQALATLQVQTMDLTEATSTDCVGFRDYWPEWRPDTKYKYQQPLRHKGLYYRASKALTSSSIYPPDTAGESEYYPIEVAPDGVIVYRTCHGQYDQVQAGETRHYPDAEGPVYRALEDTAYSPDVYPQHWKKVEGEEEA